MGTDVELVSVHDLRDRCHGVVRDWFEYVESVLSRFRPNSELSMLNGSAGRPFIASPLLVEVLRGALEAARSTDGLFDPTILHALESAGYRDSFELIGPVTHVSVAPMPDWRSIAVTDDFVVTTEQGVGIDLGGYAKGWAVDRTMPLLSGHSPCLLNAGGDVSAYGDGPDGQGWLIGVEDPFARGRDVLVIRLRNRSVATSTTTRRRWMTIDGKLAHHLIDPRTGRPSESDLASVTVIADKTAEAEVQAKALLLLGRRGAMERAHRLGIEAVLIDNSGETVIIRGDGFDVA